MAGFRRNYAFAKVMHLTKWHIWPSDASSAAGATSGEVMLLRSDVFKCRVPNWKAIHVNSFFLGNLIK